MNVNTCSTLCSLYCRRVKVEQLSVHLQYYYHYLDSLEHRTCNDSVPRHTKDVIKMVPVVPLFSTEHSKGKILALSQELRYENKCNVIENPSKSEVIGRCGGDEQTE